MISREDALHLLHEYVKSESLRRHCLAVATAMEAYAKKLGEDKDLFWITGLLHDFDFEKYPDQRHPFEGVKILKEKGYPEEIQEAILGHADYSGVPRKTMLAKCLFAVDELSGLIVALAKIRPGNFEGMTPESIEKAMKKKGFASGVHREEIEKGMHELRVKREEHFLLLISAFKEKAKELGF